MVAAVLAGPGQLQQILVELKANIREVLAVPLLAFSLLKHLLALSPFTLKDERRRS